MPLLMARAGITNPGISVGASRSGLPFHNHDAAWQAVVRGECWPPKPFWLSPTQPEAALTSLEQHATAPRPDVLESSLRSWLCC